MDGMLHCLMESSAMAQSIMHVVPATMRMGPLRHATGLQRVIPDMCESLDAQSRCALSRDAAAGLGWMCRDQSVFRLGGGGSTMIDDAQHGQTHVAGVALVLIVVDARLGRHACSSLNVVNRWFCICMLH